MTPNGAAHFTLSLLAIGLGAVVLRLPKGPRGHRTVGHGYAWCMIGVIATSFAMFNLTGRLIPFHLAALAAAVGIGGGMWTVLRRRPKRHWIQAHATWMAWSYVGLMAAFVAESLTRFVMPALAETLGERGLWPLFWGLVIAGSGLTGLVGALWIRRALPVAVAATPAAMRRERDALASQA
jgi:uncharacterized membrane protein